MESTGASCRRLGRYEILDEIGRGVMAVVYKAHDPLVQRTVALKVIQTAALAEADRAAFEARFLTEARLAGSLAHPGIVVVHDVGSDAESDRLFMALEYLEGPTLEQLTASGQPLPWAEALRIVAGVAQALHHAHERGVVHRDIKPANVVRLPSGQTKITDFGMAKMAPETYGTAGTSRMLGNPLYLSPEQAQAQEGDRRTDIFSLAAVAYRLLTGQDAFAAPNIPQVVLRIVQDEPLPPSQVAADVPHDVDHVLARALAKKPEHRHATAAELAEDVEDVLAGRPPRHAGLPTQPTPVREDTLNPKRKPGTTTVAKDGTWFPGEHTVMRRRATRRAAAGVAILVAVAGLHWMRGRGDQPAFAPAEAHEDRTRVPSVAPAAPVEAPRGAALVDLDVRHEVRRGELRVFVDDEMTLERTLAGRGRKKLLGTQYQGSLRERVSVPAGERRIRVEIQWEDHTAAASTTSDFAAGSRRGLRATMDGTLSKRLVLHWF